MNAWQDPKRKASLEGVAYLFLAPKQYGRHAAVIERAGGKAVQLAAGGVSLALTAMRREGRACFFIEPDTAASQSQVQEEWVNIHRECHKLGVEGIKDTRVLQVQRHSKRVSQFDAES